MLPALTRQGPMLLQKPAILSEPFQHYSPEIKFTFGFSNFIKISSRSCLCHIFHFEGKSDPRIQDHNAVTVMSDCNSPFGAKHIALDTLLSSTYQIKFLVKNVYLSFLNIFSKKFWKH